MALAEELAHPNTTALAYATDGILASLCRDWSNTRGRAERALDISQEHGYPVWDALSRCELGLALTRLGKPEQGIAQLEQGLLGWQATEMLSLRSQLDAWLVEAYMIAGRTQAGLIRVDETVAYVAESRECLWEAELHRLRGELLLRAMQVEGEVVVRSEAEVERAYWQAIEVARRQRAKSWELRATMSLARLWQRQGRRHEAQELLAEIYGWFTEGFDTGDLVEALALLGELSEA